MMSFVHDFYNMSENRDGDLRICDIGTDIWLVMAIHTEHSKVRWMVVHLDASD